jgi:sulfide:quinone oxidoreductase
MEALEGLHSLGAMTAGALPQRVLIAGGGAAAMEAAIALTELTRGRAAVELVAPEPSWSYRPLSVAEPFGSGHRRAYAADLLSAVGVRVTRDALAEVDAGARRATLAAGAVRDYDALLVATGAGSEPVFSQVTDAVDATAVGEVVRDVEAGYVHELAFIAPPQAGWTLPLYELCLQLAERAPAADLTLVTHEDRPLEAFGTAAAALAERLLAGAGVRLVTGAQPQVTRGRWYITRPDADPNYADRVIALPRPVGCPVAGLGATGDGFLPVDILGRVAGRTRIYAAGDVTDRPLKQGGLATQQADAAAAAIAADLGLAGAAVPVRPVLRGLLVTGAGGWFLRRDLEADPAGEVSREPLWWPPTKIAGRHLTPFLDALDAERDAPRLERALARPAGAARRRALIARTRDGLTAITD